MYDHNLSGKCLTIVDSACLTLMCFAIFIKSLLLQNNDKLFQTMKKFYHAYFVIKLRARISREFHTKFVQAGIFDWPQIRQFMKDAAFTSHMDETERNA